MADKKSPFVDEAGEKTERRMGYKRRRRESSRAETHALSARSEPEARESRPKGDARAEWGAVVRQPSSGPYRDRPAWATAHGTRGEPPENISSSAHRGLEPRRSSSSWDTEWIFPYSDSLQGVRGQSDDTAYPAAAPHWNSYPLALMDAQQPPREHLRYSHQAMLLETERRNFSASLASERFQAYLRDAHARGLASDPRRANDDYARSAFYSHPGLPCPPFPVPLSDMWRNHPYRAPFPYPRAPFDEQNYVSSPEVLRVSNSRPPRAPAAANQHDPRAPRTSVLGHSTFRDMAGGASYHGNSLQRRRCRCGAEATRLVRPTIQMEPEPLCDDCQRSLASHPGLVHNQGDKSSPSASEGDDEPKAMAAGPKGSQKSCECGRRVPSFGIAEQGRKSARWCRLCPSRPPEAVNVINRRCECGASKASLALPGESGRMARWCARCPGKDPNAVDVTNRMCMCGTSRPSFGLPGDAAKEARWCMNCPSKPADAVDVRSKKCECGRVRPSFGLASDSSKDARWCIKCPNKPSDAIDVVSKRCECGQSQPNFALPDQERKSARWCAKCPNKPSNAVYMVRKSRRSGSSAGH